jgi:hypothetical protein
MDLLSNTAGCLSENPNHWVFCETTGPELNLTHSLWPFVVHVSRAILPAINTGGHRGCARSSPDNNVREDQQQQVISSFFVVADLFRPERLFFIALARICEALTPLRSLRLAAVQSSLTNGLGFQSPKISHPHN